ncbi:hypothetical protein [Thalassoglobus polymorphus]|uniref:hypothetical protein n=1 Tax=Thalassoglobus polymorphus TaxID=2527994 RepID=UPI00119F9750|nr:hypothetical protein [Thalassoglobus polymorphus]
MGKTAPDDAKNPRPLFKDARKTADLGNGIFEPYARRRKSSDRKEKAVLRARKTASYPVESG